MGRVCAISTCRSWFGRSKKNDKKLSFFKFPKDKNMRTTWISKCKRSDPFDPSKTFVCSEHFSSEDLDPTYLTKLRLMPEAKHQPSLKPDAIPSRNLPSCNDTSACSGTAKEERLKRRSSVKQVQDLLMEQESPASQSTEAPGESAPDGDQKMSADRQQIQKLKKELHRLQARHRAHRIKWRRETAHLRREVSKLRRMLSLASAPQQVLSNQQLQRLATGRRIRWKAEDVAKAVGLRSISRKAYTYAQHVLKIPLPSNSTLARWTRSFQIGFGVIDAAVWVLRPAVEAMTGLERIACICFDEMALDSMPSYDQSADRILAGSKLQLMVVRGLCSPWKQPIFHELDAPMTMAKLSAVVRTLEELGLDIRAVTSDMGPTNESLWRDAGVDRERTWISHPADPAKKLWVFADVPHLVKLIRHHVVKEGGGLLIPDGSGGEICLDASPFQQLRAVDGAEKKICPRLTDLCIEARGQTAQRVYLATRLFSNTVATAMEVVLQKDAVARVIRIIDRWFDVLNSRCVSDPKLERCGFGMSDAARAAQDAALSDMDHLASSARKAGTRRRLGSTSALLPFQRGILRSSASLRGLYADLTSAYPDQLRYILTARLNQDCLENTFSQLRSMCGPNTHPDAVEVRQRLRILLMAPSALRAVSCPERAVEVEAGPDFLSTGAAVTHSDTVSGSALDGLDVLFVDQTAEQTEVDHAYAAVRETPGSADNRADELGLDRHGLAFVAGYVARKMHHIDPTLGCPSAEASEEQLNSVPSSWLSALSRGGLFMPRPWWMAVVCEFDDDFQRIMGSSFCDQPGLLRRLSQVISQRHPGLDQRIARRLARVRMFMRVGELRQQLKRQRDDRRASRQVRQHVTSQR